ncbi:MAG: FecR domain-containing protein [Bacteroidota bacterium]
MDLEKFRRYTELDFCEERMFIDWVLSPDKHLESFWNAFLEEYPEKKEALATARRLIARTTVAMTAEGFSLSEEEELMEGIFMGIRREEKTYPQKRYSLPYWSTWAAMIVLLLSVSGGLYFLNQAVEMRSYQSTFGELKSLRLPDNSLVKLYPNSAIEFEEVWEEGAKREVWLRGEAYFEVEKKRAPTAKFLVHTPDLKVEVLGTEFNVNTRKDQTEVVLNEGQVKLKLEGQNPQALLMQPGDMVSYSRKKDRLAQQKVDSKVRTSWKEGIQQFDQVPLSKVVDSIEEIYGIHLELEEAVLANMVVVGIPMENRDIALATLEGILGKTLIPLSDQRYTTD